MKSKKGLYLVLFLTLFMSCSDDDDPKPDLAWISEQEQVVKTFWPKSGGLVYYFLESGILKSVDTKTKEIREVTDIPFDAAYYGLWINSQGTIAYFITQGCQTELSSFGSGCFNKVDLKTGEITTLLDGITLFPIAEFNDRYLAIVKGFIPGSTGIFLISLESGESKQLQTVSIPLSFSTDGAYLAMFERGGAREIYNTLTGEAEVLTTNNLSFYESKFTGRSGLAARSPLSNWSSIEVTRILSKQHIGSISVTAKPVLTAEGAFSFYLYGDYRISSSGIRLAYVTFTCNSNASNCKQYDFVLKVRNLETQGDVEVHQAAFTDDLFGMTFSPNEDEIIYIVGNNIYRSVL